MLIGYARVSTDDQDLSLQCDALRQAACQKIYEDKLSGVQAARPGLDRLMESLRSGDELVVWRLDRLGRSLKDLIALVEVLEERGVGLVSLHESISTTSSSGKLVFHLFAALAEFERNLIRERTQAGLVAARSRGRKGGRPKALDLAKRQLVVRLYDERRLSVAEICRMLGISKPTLYAYLDEVENH
jgi:DNA invertase Pin-like site-specific DNA recombinase